MSLELEFVTFHVRNFQKREECPITNIIINVTYGIYDVMKQMDAEGAQFSVNYVIERTGQLVELVPPEFAGAGAQPNSLTILVFFNEENDKAMEQLFYLTKELAYEYKIPLNRIDGSPEVPWFQFLNTLGNLLLEKELENLGGESS